MIKWKVRERHQNAMDAAYYAIGRKWKKKSGHPALTGLYVWVALCSCQQKSEVQADNRKREYNGRSGTLFDSQVQYHLQAYLLGLPLSFQKKKWSHTSRVLCSGIPFVTWNLCKNSYQVPEMILKGRERILWVEFPKSAIVTKPKMFP